MESRAWLASLVDATGDAVIGFDPEGRVVSWNPGAEIVYGYSEQEMLGQSDERLLPAGARNELWEMLLRAPPDVSFFKLDAQYRRKDGQAIDVSLTASRVKDDAGATRGWAIVGRDATEAKRLRRTLLRQVETYTAIARSLPLGSVSLFDLDFRYVAAEGPELFELFRTSSAQIVGKRVGEAATPANREALLELCGAALTGQVGELELVVGERTLLVRSSPVMDPGGGIMGGILLSLDVTDRAAKEEELERTKLLLEATFSNIGDGVALLDGRKRFLLANEAYRRILALPADMLEMDLPAFSEHLRGLVADPGRLGDDLGAPESGSTGTYTREILFVRPVRRWLRRAITSVQSGGERFYLVVWRDVTSERDQAAARDREVFTDALTGIPNRRAAEGALETVSQRVEKFSIAMFDIDHFKRINDQHGHATGDEVLKRVAAALAGQSRAKDLVARWGGEEFIAVLNTDLAGAQVFCERARGSVAALELGAVGQVTISVGVAEHEPGRAVELSVERADRALYEAKKSGRNRVSAG